MNFHDMIRFDEGNKLEIYRDSEGYWTAGVGHLVTKNPSKAFAIDVLDKELSRKTNGKITELESKTLLNQDIDKAIKSINISSIAGTYNKLDENRKYALMNMVFQLGLAGVMNFKKMISNLAIGNYQAASLEALDSKWARQTPNRAKRVAAVIRTGTLNSYA